jgi:hypothetical protein
VALKSLAEMEAEHVRRVLDFTQGHKGRACEILGISRPALDLDRKNREISAVLVGTDGLRLIRKRAAREPPLLAIR